ncbi:glycosyltransferase [Aquimarina sp. 2201CG1-2-11]|uniref:glycosyltransferase n=1 Tax=Aquimarina discodermiae TaxID=3231043 RepID=UPI003461A594
MTKKRLLILIPGFPHDGRDTFTTPFIQQFLVSLLENYKELDIIIYSLYIPKGKPYTWRSIRVIPLNIPQKTWFLKLFSLVKSLFKIGNHLRRHKVDGILSFWYSETAMLGNILSFVFQKKHFVWLQGQDVKESNRFMKYFRPNPDNLIAISNFQNKHLYSAFGFKAKTTIPIAVTPSFFPKLNEYSRNIDILGVGALIPLKNYDLFLNIISELHKTLPNIRVVLIGNGSLEENLQRTIREEKLTNIITLPGLLPHQKVLEYMNNTKIFIHTSYFEGGATVLHEALYSGCQVISTLPIIEGENIPFYNITSKKEIVHKVKMLLEEGMPVKRFCSSDHKSTTKIVHDLFFG